MFFEDLPLSKSIQKGLISKGFLEPTPIQEKVIPEVLRHNDIIGSAQTGTGKTAAFAIPIVNLLHKKIGTSTGKKELKALIVCPTRELAVQIHQDFEAFSKFTKLTAAVVFGGTSMQPQINLLKKGIHILIATPGRLLDLRKQDIINLNTVEFLVLDEADLMLDMGFLDDVKKIIRMSPNVNQRLLFSATMPEKVNMLATSFLQNPIKVEVSPEISAAETVNQKLYMVAKPNKNELLLHILRNQLKNNSILIFRRTKFGVEKTLETLTKNGFTAEAIHGDKSQSARQNALNTFKNGENSILIATDVAARGIDIENLDAVVNFDIPEQPEMYVHRIGRTGRAGKTGISLSFCSPEEKRYLNEIEALLGETIPVEEDNLFPAEKKSSESKPKKGSKHKKSRKGAGSKARKKRWY